MENTTRQRIENFCIKYNLDFEIKFYNGSYTAKVFHNFNLKNSYCITTERYPRKIRGSLWETLECLADRIENNPFYISNKLVGCIEHRKD